MAGTKLWLELINDYYHHHYPAAFLIRWGIQHYISLSGILTKPDLVDKGTEENVVKIVHNEVIPLKKGYMVVKCRGQKEITEKVSLSEALKNEEAFFEEHAHFQ